MSAGAAQACLVMWLKDYRAHFRRVPDRKPIGIAAPFALLPHVWRPWWCPAHGASVEGLRPYVFCRGVSCRAGRVERVPERVELVTGWGRHSRVKGESEVKDSVTGALLCAQLAARCVVVRAALRWDQNGNFHIEGSRV